MNFRRNKQKRRRKRRRNRTTCRSGSHKSARIGVLAGNSAGERSPQHSVVDQRLNALQAASSGENLGAGLGDVFGARTSFSQRQSLLFLLDGGLPRSDVFRACARSRQGQSLPFLLDSSPRRSDFFGASTRSQQSYSLFGLPDLRLSSIARGAGVVDHLQSKGSSIIEFLISLKVFLSLEI